LAPSRLKFDTKLRKVFLNNLEQCCSTKMSGLDPTFCLCSPSTDFLTIEFLTLNWRPVASWGLWEFVPGVRRVWKPVICPQNVPAKLLCVRLHICMCTHYVYACCASHRTAAFATYEPLLFL